MEMNKSSDFINEPSTNNNSGWILPDAAATQSQTQLKNQYPNIPIRFTKSSKKNINQHLTKTAKKAATEKIEKKSAKMESLETQQVE